MQQLFKEIYTQLSTLKDSSGNPMYIRMWNNQLELVMSGKMELFSFPAIFIEFGTANTLGVMGGGGIQNYDPVVINLHILHWQLDSNGNFIDGGFEQNLDVYDTKQDVYRLMQKFKPSKGMPMIRTSETQDYFHAGVYHFIQSYHTTWADDAMEEPVNGIDMDVPIGLEMVVCVDESEDPYQPYTFGPYTPEANLETESEEAILTEDNENLTEE